MRLEHAISSSRTSRNPWRCHRRTVSGLTISSASFQFWSRLASKTKSSTIRTREARPFDRAVEDDELLTKQQVFSDQLWFAPNEVDDGPEHRAVRDRLGHARDGGRAM